MHLNAFPVLRVKFFRKFYFSNITCQEKELYREDHRLNLKKFCTIFQNSMQNTKTSFN